MRRSWRRRAWGLGLVVTAVASVGLCEPRPGAPMDLKAPFHTRSPWKLVVKQAPDTEDYGGNPAPGAIDICLQKSPADACLQKPVAADSTPPGMEPLLWGPHYLEVAKPVYPNGPSGAPLLQIVTASLHGGDGGQAVVSQLLKYDADRDAFERIYFQSTGTNNNQEVRFVDRGPLRGGVITAEPTGNAPFAYWITVSRLTPQGAYRQALRYRSATGYNDGNPLAVIDSEMPAIEQRLGLWRPGSPLPLPAGKSCPKPHLKRGALWCG